MVADFFLEILSLTPPLTKHPPLEQIFPSHRYILGESRQRFLGIFVEAVRVSVFQKVEKVAVRPIPELIQCACAEAFWIFAFKAVTLEIRDCDSVVGTESLGMPRTR